MRNASRCGSPSLYAARISHFALRITHSVSFPYLRLSACICGSNSGSFRVFALSLFRVLNPKEVHDEDHACGNGARAARTVAAADSGCAADAAGGRAGGGAGADG